MIPTYPEDCPQSLTPCDEWWVQHNTQELESGCLLWTFVPHVDQIPMALVAQGRSKSTNHDLADCEIIPANSDRIFQRSRLPVASLPCYPNEVRTVYRSKKRPALLIILPGADIPRSMMASKPRSLTRPTAVVAPYYGRDEETGRRSGFPQAFVDRVRCCEYPRFVWDKLPIEGSEESILRLDHLLPMSTNHVAYEKTEWKLSDEAFHIIMEWFEWYYTGAIPENNDSLLCQIREELMN